MAEFAVRMGVDEGIEAFVLAERTISGNGEILPSVVASAWNDAFTTDFLH
jgi:hypothetical protein